MCGFNKIFAQTLDIVPIDIYYQYLEKKNKLSSVSPNESIFRIATKDSSFTISRGKINIRGKVKDFRGELTLNIEDRELGLNIIGQYINGLDLLKNQATIYNTSIDSLYIGVSTYYQPLMSGEWRYYSIRTKKLLYTLIFKDGLIISPAYLDQNAK